MCINNVYSDLVCSVGDYETAVHSYHQKGQKYVMRFQRSKGKVSIALHRDCGVADQLKAALVVEILNYVTKHKDFAPVCSMYTHTVALFLNV